MISQPLLGVNVDHVATIREARGTDYPDPVSAAIAAIDGGAQGITVHLREDRRHIQSHDVQRLLQTISVPLNLEMAATTEMIDFALECRPAKCCLVPERREELTTEGGLDVVGAAKSIKPACARLVEAGIETSLFIDPDLAQIEAAKETKATVIELHTGTYAEHESNDELRKLGDAAAAATALGLTVNAGHGLTTANVRPVADISEIRELNIGHSIVARALLVGMENAVREMIEAINGNQT